MERLLTTAKAKTIINLLVLCAAVLFALPINTHAATTLAELQAVLEANYPDGLPQSLTPEEKQWMAENPAPPAPVMPEGLEAQAAAAIPPGTIHTPAEYEAVYGTMIAWGPASSAQRDILNDYVVGVTTDPNMNSLVWIGVTDAAMQTTCTTALTTHSPAADMDRVRFYYYTFNALWITDFGPRSVIQNGNTSIVIDHKYNRTRPLDDAFPAWSVANHMPWANEVSLYNWGGNTDANSMIHGGGNWLNFSNGDGFSSRLIVDENPTRTEAQIIQSFHDYFDVNETLFPRLLTTLDSTSHIDMWFMPLGDNKVVISTFTTAYPDAKSKTDAAAAAMAARGYTVYRTPAWSSTGNETTAGTHYTYTNMAIVNKKVFVPTYNHANDAGALATIASALPGYTIVSLDCSGTISLAGAIHCIMKHIYDPVNPFGEVLKPNGGETLAAGQPYTIKWIANDDVRVASIDLEYSTNNGSTWNTIATGEPHDGYYTWTAPSVDSTQCQVRVIVHDNLGNTYTDASNANFTITTAPIFVAAGTGVSGTAAITVPWPTHQVGDVGLLFIESTGGQAANLTTPAGFVNVTNSPQSTGTGTVGTRLTVYWCRATSSSMTSPVVTAPGNHAYGRILTFRNVISTGDPWDVTAGGIKATASTTTTFGTVTTTVNNDLIVLAASRDNSSTAQAWSAWTNANLSGITEQSDGGTTAGNGGGIGVATGVKATAGAIGSSTATVTSSVDGHMTIALKPATGGSPPPGPASNPVPSTGATNVSLTQDLSWSAGSGVATRDVYFGTVNPPVTKVITDGTVLTYDTGTMATSTTYYWRVDEKNTGGTTTGAVWSFGTVPPPPAPASSPTPTNGATNVSRTQDLSWSAGSGVATRDVYFGTVNPPVTKVITDGTVLTYDTGTMATSTTYYWRVDEKNTGGTTTGAVWSFGTVPPPPAPASSPTPTNGATNVSRTQDLSWSAGSGVATRDVYFGTVNPPVTKVITDGTVLTYDTGTMATSTTYYWRVDEKNTGGTTTGAVWSFGTVPPPPAPASSPTPTNGATNVSRTQDLSWSAGSGVATRDVYFGTVNPPVTKVITDGTVLTYDTGTMATSTTYYWRVDEKNTGGTTTGAVWSFGTVPPPPAPASSPTPTNGATNVSRTQDLSWSAGSGVATRDVYFGTVNPPVTKVITDGTVLTYDTGTMATSTTYYWRVDEKNTGGTTTGAVWSFGTVPPPPAPASSPTPTNGATNVSRTQDLSWSAGSGVATRDVYFGTVNPPVTKVITDGTVLTYDTGTMTNNKTYYWRVDEKNTGGTTTGTVWSFATIASVPNVVGSAQADANSAIIGAGLVVGTITPQCSDTVAAGNVISQDPTAGTQANVGSAVNLVISSGQPSVPDVTGQAQATAIANINAVANISYGSSTTECSNTVDAGDVISQSSVGTVACGTVVNLVISSGQPSVPNVVGQTQAEAIAAIGGVANISYGSSTTECSNTVDAGNVISQSATGTVTCGTVVNLVISSGQPSVPDVTGQAQATAIANINAVANISYGSSTTQCSDTVDAGNVISQSATGTVTCGTVVNLVISSGQPSVPDVTGQAQATAIANINAVANISYGSSTTECSNTVDAGDVISQSSVGTVACGTVVNLVISSGQPSVPNVVGQTQAEAIAAIGGVANISYGSSTTECSNTVDAGNVISQSATGTVTCGTVVNLVISSGQPSVPDVTGQAQATAIANINAVANISYGSSTTQCSDTVDAGNVISQSATGTVTCGTVVNLVISSGQPSVPDVTGQAQATAIANINAVANISYGSSTTECSNTVDAGDVISQSSVGTVACGTVVNLVISSGQPSVPNVVGQTQAEAIAAIGGVANISYGSSTTECSNTVDAGNVISQSATGTVTCGTVVNLVISSGQPSVPDVTGQAQATAIANINAVANISYGSSTTQCSDTVDAGNVISQSATGTVTCGTVVNLVISSGQPSVPDVTGQAQATAIANINAVANISYGSSTTECSDTVDAGDVISQSATGTVTCGTVVNLVISSGQPSVPDVTGQAQATAIANINAVANISYGSSTTECSNTVTAGNVISQSVTGITTCGTVVNLVISSGQPSVPDVTGQAQATAIANINAVANISYGSSTTECSNTVTAGNVISQSVTGITTCGTVVNLVISSGQPSVPDVTGQAQATAIANINAVANISYGSSTTECSNTVTAGNVISQSATGTVTCGTVVNLVISSGQPSVPDVTGQAQATAIANINAVANISYGSSTTECSDTVAAGNVISQSVTGITTCGTVVNLVISSGQPSVPNVVGSTQAEAIAAIGGVANISYGSSTTECSDTVEAGDVISQSSTGTVTCGTVVNLVISSGQPTVPNVVGSTQAEAIAAIGGVANISYGSSTTQCSDTVDAGDVISQSATGIVTCGTVVNLVISSGQPSVPDVTGQAQATAIANINAVANISYGSSTTQCSDTVDAGNVISQSATGTVNCGTVVNLVISSGQPSVPDVTGQAQATAIANINAVANISYGSSTTECSDTVDAGDVISQSATGIVTCGTVVNLVISSGQPSVPNVVGSTQAEAIAAIGGVANISYGSSTTECSDTVEAGDVISQSSTGTVTCGTVVNLVISSGQPTVPDVTGQPQATAIANINAVANISYGSSTTQCSDTVDAGNVISQSATGTVNCGTVVNLVISSGQPSVPDVTGQAQATAIANINAVANISYGSSTTECSDTVDAGDVISQSATGIVTCGTVVNLVISSGQPSVPDVTGQAQATAIANINAVANISYGSSTTECSDTVDAGDVISQSATGTVNCGTVVNLVISSGQPSVPNVVGSTQAEAIAAIGGVANISYGSSTTECSNTVDAGDVISQSSTGIVNCGTVVNLVISSGQPSVPNVVGMTQAEAIAAIGGVANISYGSSTTQCSDTVDAGDVISQSATGIVNCGTVVNLVISSGQPTVPDVTGQPQATAIANINAVANISYGSSTTECSDTVAAGNVISQSVTGITTCGTVVNLVISSGQPSVPDVTGQAEATAIANINAVANISYGSSTTECSDTVDAGDVISQSVTGITTCGTVVNLVISSGQPTVPNVVGSTQAEAIAAIGGVANISYGSSTTQCSDTIAAGNVISQSATGTVTCGTVVNLVISSGQPSVPNVVGSTQAEAIAAIGGVANISYGSSTTQYSETVLAGNVISQSATGTVICGTVVDLVVSIGRQPPVTVTSNGTGGGDWNTGTTWIGGVVPRDIDSAVIQGSDIVTLAAPGSCANLTMNAGTKLTITAGGPIPGSSWSLDPASTIEFNTLVPASWVNPTFGNLIFNVPNYSLPASITVAGNLSILNNTLRGIGTTSGTNIHNIAGNVNISGTGRITGVNQSGANTASCTWNIGGNLTLGTTSNRIQLYESAGPHTGSAVFNIDGTLTIGTSSILMLKTTSPSSLDYPEGIVNLKGNLVQNGTIGINSMTAGTSPGLSVNFVGTNAQDWSGIGTFSVSSFSVNMNINNAAGVTLTSPRTIPVRAAVILTNGKLTTTSTNLLTVTAGSVSGGNSSSYINGPLARSLVAGPQSIGFPVGDTAKYAPVNLEFGNVGTTGTITVNTTPGMHPQIATSDLDSSKTLNRYYTVTNSTATFDTVTATFNFDPTDVIGGADPAQYIVKKFDTGVWTTPATANPSATSIQATGVTSFSDFAIGQLCQASVPDVTGHTQAEAIADINAVANISYGSSTTECSDTVEAGDVISQSATGIVNCGTVVDLVISSGQPSVPDVTGQAEATAIANINAVANISYGSSTTQYSDTVPAGDVISQSVTGTVPCGTVVDLVVSLGKQIVSLAEDFNDNERSAMWRMTSYDPEKTRVSEYTQRLNLRAAGQMDITASCVGHWKLNDNAANTTVLDSSGTNHNGTASRNTNLLAVADGINGAFRFNGTSDYVAVQTIGTGSYTKVAWINLELSTSPYSHNILSGGGNQAFWAPYQWSNKLSAGHNGIYNQVQDSVSLQLGTWYFAALTYNSSTNTLTLYKNGAVVSTGSTTTPSAPSALTIGKYSSYYFKGMIDNVMLFNRVLTGDEITALYNNSNGTETLPTYTPASNEFSANGWNVDVNDNFQAKVDFHYSSVSSPAAWVGMTIENDQDNYISITAGANGSSPYFEYEKVVDGVVTSEETARASNDGTLYISYDKALDELYLSYTGYGAANAWQTITGLLNGSWSLKPLSISLGGGSDGSSVDNDQAYLDNFAASGSFLGWPPATDVDNNGFIDWADVMVIAENWLDTGSTPADIDGDGTVNFADFAELGLAW